MTVVDRVPVNWPGPTGEANGALTIEPITDPKAGSGSAGVRIAPPIAIGAADTSLSKKPITTRNAAPTAARRRAQNAFDMSLNAPSPYQTTTLCSEQLNAPQHT